MNDTVRIVVVDDSPDDRAHVKSALLSGSTTRFKFLEACTCADALRIFNEAEPRSIDCMILDFDLPDGEATDVLKALPRFEGMVDVPVLVLTGSGLDKNKVVLRSGAHEYLGKGWMTASSITRAVENAIDRHSTSRELAQSHARLRASEAAAKSIADSSPVVMWVTDQNGACSYLNKKWTEITGQREQQWSGQGWLTAVAAEDRGEAARTLQEAVASQKPFTLRLRIVGIDGSQMWMLMDGSPHRVNDVFMGFVGSATDLTDQKDLEQIVSERTAKLRQTIGELEAVSYSLSHDLRQPLRSMQQTSQILLEDYAGSLDPAAQEHLSRIVNASRRLDRLIQDVLTLGRVSRMSDHMKAMDLQQLIRDVITQYAIFQSQNVEVEFSGKILPVLGHEALLGQIVSNLLGNAVKFKSPERRLEVRISTEDRGEFVRLVIEDNGIGIATENVDRIWRIFERIPGTVATEGTGIGLAIVKRAAERMGGHVGVQSVINEGSRFWIDLPKPT